MNKKQKKQYLIVANWKMYLSFYESVCLCSINQQRLKAIAKKQQLVFLPSFIALNVVAQLLKETTILHGAQDCSIYQDGAYTGEISAQMLKELDCSFCLVGHGERRTYFAETDKIVAEKYTQLQQANVQPIVCIGEQEKQKTIREVKTIVRNQLAFFTQKKMQERILIAYEPGWAITRKGKNDPAERECVQEIMEYIEEIVSHYSTRDNMTLLYGASLTEKNIRDYVSIKQIDGFLLGSSSTKIESLESIVHILSE
jgi:triosephosphate isomerase (TIM)